MRIGNRGYRGQMGGDSSPGVNVLSRFSRSWPSEHMLLACPTFIRRNKENSHSTKCREAIRSPVICIIGI